MGVFVILAVAQVAHQVGDRIAQVDRDRHGNGFLDIFFDFVIGRIDGITLGRGGQIYSGLSQGIIGFRHAQEIHGVLGGYGNQQGLGVGVAYVFGGKADHSSGDIERFLA